MDTIIPKLKTCTKCGESKALKFFQEDSRYKGGHRTQCLKCRDEYLKQYGIDNRAKRTEQTRIRYWRKRGFDTPPLKREHATIARRSADNCAK